MAKKRGNGEGYIRQRPDGRWEVQVVVGTKPNRKPHRKSLYGRTKAEVTKKLRALRKKLDDGLAIETKSMTLGQLTERWLEHKRGRGDIGEGTYHQYRNGLSKFRPLFNQKLEKLTAYQVDQIYTQLQSDGLSPRTIEIAHNALNGALSQAVKWEVLSRNVLEQVTKPKQVKAEVNYWDTGEVITFLAYTRPHRLHALFHLALATGMRRGELIGLRWSDLDVANNRLSVRQNIVAVQGKAIVKQPKTEASRRTVHIQAQDMAALEAHRQAQLAERDKLGPAWQDHDLVFPSEVGTPLSPRNLSRLFTSLQKQAGVKRIKFHELRHTHVSLLIKNGVPAKVVSQRIGHTNAGFTQSVYQHLNRLAAFRTIGEQVYR